MAEMRNLSSGRGDAGFTVPRKPLPTRQESDQQHLAHHDSDDVEDGELLIPLKKTPSTKIWRQGFRNLFKYAWFIELASCCLAVLAFVAIIITLAVHQDRPQPQWPRLITINTLIAIFTTIFKASLLLPIAEGMCKTLFSIFALLMVVVGISQLKWLWYHQPHDLIDLHHFDSASRGPWGSGLLLWHIPRKFVIRALSSPAL